MNPFYIHFVWPPSIRYGFVLVMILWVCACKKDDEPIFPYPSVFHATQTNITSEIRLFTKQGEVKDQAVITGFIHRYQEPWTFAAPKSGVVSLQDTIKIAGRDKAQLGSNPRNFHLQFHDNMIYFVPQDTVTLEMSDLYDMIVSIEKYKPLYEKRLTVSSGTGFKQISHSILGNYAKYISNQLAFPMLSFLITQNPYGYYASKSNNSFDPTGYKALNTGDTLAIQESVVVYER